MLQEEEISSSFRTAAIIQNVIYGSMLLMIIFTVYFVVFHFY